GDAFLVSGRGAALGLRTSRRRGEDDVAVVGHGHDPSKRKLGCAGLQDCSVTAVVSDPPRSVGASPRRRKCPPPRRAPSCFSPSLRSHARRHPRCPFPAGGRTPPCRASPPPSTWRRSCAQV